MEGRARFHPPHLQALLIRQDADKPAMSSSKVEVKSFLCCFFCGGGYSTNLGGGFKYLLVRCPTAGFVRHDKSVDKSVVSNIFYFHPYLGKIPNLTNIFQMG